jgi:hypothetical protein
MKHLLTVSLGLDTVECLNEDFLNVTYTRMKYTQIKLIYKDTVEMQGATMLEQ